MAKPEPRRQMVFEIVDGRPVPRLPRVPSGIYLSLAETARLTRQTPASLRRRYWATYAGILDDANSVTVLVKPADMRMLRRLAGDMPVETVAADLLRSALRAGRRPSRARRFVDKSR